MSGSLVNQILSESRGDIIEQKIGSHLFYDSEVVTGKGGLEKA